MGATPLMASVTAMAASIALVGCTSLKGNDDGDADGEPFVDDGTIVSSPVDVPPPKGMSCAYPQAATYGVAPGATVSSSLKWWGLPPNEGEREFMLAELYDCDGMKEVDAILVSTTQYG